MNFGIGLTLVNGSLNFLDIVGGGTSTSTTNYGLNIGAAVTAPVITGRDIVGGPGTNNNWGLYVNAALGSAATNVLIMTASSLGIGSNEYGINVANTVAVGSGATMTLTGTGGGVYNGTGTLNHGIYLNGSTITSSGTGATAITLTGLGGQGSGGTNAGAYIGASGLTVNFGTSSSNQLNFLNCIGGFVGSTNYGVYVGGTVTTTGTGLTQFLNATGGGNGTGTNNNGLHFAANYSAPAIIAEATGGFGKGTTTSTGNYGVYIGTGITLGGTGANQIRLTGTSLGTGSFEFGIKVDSTGTIQVGNGGTLSLKGSGGGLYNGTGASNYGVELANATLTAGNGGTTVNTINVSGVGGTGTGGLHYGVDIETVGFHVNLNGTNAANSINFVNCVGGSGGLSNIGVNFATSLSLVNGSLNFQSISGGAGGSGTTNHHGVVVNLGTTVTAPAIIAVDCFSGLGTGTDIGFSIGGTLGSAATNQVSITAGSVGTASNGYGIQVFGTVTVGSGATMTLTGSGGGTYNDSGTLNHGIYLNGATLTSSGAGATVMTLTGFGGSGSNTHGGAYIDTSGLTVNFGTSSSNQLNFLNCIGGFVGSNNYGVYVGGPVTTTGTGLTQFLNATGGGNGTGTNNNGLHFAANYSAPDIIAEATGGFGKGTTTSTGNYGIYIAPTITLGGSTTNQIRLIGSSLGTGSFEFGIKVDSTGTIQVGDGGTLSLKGSGGGLYNGTGASNYGVELANATLTAGNGGSTVNTINVSGFGGIGTVGSHFGVDIETVGFSVNLNGTNPSNSINFINCAGGSGGSSNYGVNFSVGLTLVNGSLNFLNVVGGGTSTSITNYGLNIGGVTVTAPVITGRDIVGGPGFGNNYGLNIGSSSTTSQLGTSLTNVLTISATSLGLGSNEYGINIFGSGGASSVVVGNGATLTLMGVGGGVYNGSGSDNHGIYLNNAVLTSSGSSATTMTLTGLGGQGSGGTNAGTYIASTGLTVNFGTNASNQLNFLNCIGGFALSNNYGVYVGGPVTTTGTGLTQFLNATGGGNGTGTNNNGLHFAANYSAPDIIAEATGGFGKGSTATNGNYGVYVGTGITLGGTGANQIRLTGSSLGTGSYEFGIAVYGGTIQVGDSGTLSLKGSGGGLYNGTGSHNYGVELANAATLTAGNGGTTVNTIDVSGVGGIGTGGVHYGVDIETVGFSVNLNGTNAANSINFISCAGGSGGASNYGVNFNISLNFSQRLIEPPKYFRRLGRKRNYSSSRGCDQ